MNDEKLHALLNQMVADMGAAAAAPLVILGDKLGLYRTLSEKGPLTSKELAEATGTDARYIREWCAAQAASGYISYDAKIDSFSLSPEQVAVFADSESPVCMAGGFYSISSLYADEPQITEAFKTGAGVPWGAHDSCLFCGTEKFFRPGYKAHLVNEWLPALEGVTDKLRGGGTVADVGCGHGASTLVMAEAFPDSKFVGFDFHKDSIRCAQERARQSGLTNVEFQVASAKDFPGTNYDLIAFFDCLHDMGDPVGACRHAHGALAKDGTMMIVEPMAADSLAENLNPVSRLYYCFSTMVCTPASKSQEVGLALGAQAGEANLGRTAIEGGFTQFRRATQTPFNLVLEARP